MRGAWALVIFAVLGCEKSTRARDAAGPAPAPDATPRERRPGSVAACAASEAAVVTATADAWRACALARADAIDALLQRKASMTAVDDAAGRTCKTSAQGVYLELGEQDFFAYLGRDRIPGKRGKDRVTRDRGTAACLPGKLATLGKAAEAAGAGGPVQAVLDAEAALDDCVPAVSEALLYGGLLGSMAGTADDSTPPPAGPFEEECVNDWQTDPALPFDFGALGGSGGGGIGLGTIGTLGSGKIKTKTKANAKGKGKAGYGIGALADAPPAPKPPPDLELISGTTPSNLATIQRRVRWAFCRRHRQLRCCADAAAVATTDTPTILRVDVGADGAIAAIAGEGATAKFATCATDVLAGMPLVRPDQGPIALRFRTSLPASVSIP